MLRHYVARGPGDYAVVRYESAARLASSTKPKHVVRDAGARLRTRLIKCRCDSYVEGSSAAAGVEQQETVIAALGKFDALHVGHRALALEAAAVAKRIQPRQSNGVVCIFSFSGMAECFGWPKRLPIVAKADRGRVLRQWSESLGLPVIDFVVPFASVRRLSPEAFVSLLHRIGIQAIVTGEDYRFGYKAAGDTEILRVLCSERRMEVSTVSLVAQGPQERDRFGSECDYVEDLSMVPKVSSTAIRGYLAVGKLSHVHDLLGRRHRMLVSCSSAQYHRLLENGQVEIPTTSCLNQYPLVGQYMGTLWVGSGSPAVFESKHADTPGDMQLLSEKIAHELGHAISNSGHSSTPFSLADQPSLHGGCVCSARISETSIGFYLSHGCDYQSLMDVVASGEPQLVILHFEFD